MDQVYVGLLTFLVSGALIVVGCHIGISIQQHKASLDRCITQAQTRIRSVRKIHTSTPTSTTVSSVLQTQRWPVSRSEFRGFNSPPGRF
jgi:hypothetical protein